MRSLPSSSSSPSSSSYSLTSTCLNNRLKTIFKKAEELSILCGIEIAVIYYGPQGEVLTWPHDKEKVRDMALRYIRLNESLRSKKRVNLSEFLKNNGLENPNKRRKTCPKDQGLDLLIQDKGLDKLIQSLEVNISTSERRLRFLVSQEKPQLLDHHQSLASSSSLPTQSLNSSQQFSLLVYNHGDNTLSQIPLSASNLNQDDFSALLRESQLKNEHNMY